MTGQRRTSRFDTYAAHRCPCGHICYLDDVPGGSCRFCDCTSHRSPAQAASGKAAAK